MRFARTGLFLLSILSSSYADSQQHLQGFQPPSNYSDAYVRNATDNLIFTTIASLLQQWPNTRYRNGHTIVKGTIPPGTVLCANFRHLFISLSHSEGFRYHGRGDKNIPLEPEWLAFNVEHSYVLCQLPECCKVAFSTVLCF
jgi:hypothetical protein